MNTQSHTQLPAARVGHGWDRHRLDLQKPAGNGRPLVVGGITLQSESGPVAHSDGDALAHALTDALLGAAGLGDIGQMFPDSDPANDGRDSIEMLRLANKRVRDAGWRVGNADLTVLLEQPKLGPARPRIQKTLADALDTDEAAVNIKAKTGEGIGVVGRGEAIEAFASVLLQRDAT